MSDGPDTCLTQSFLRLDYQARVYLVMRFGKGLLSRDIAKALKVNEGGLWNKYGGKKLVLRVRREICQMNWCLT